MNVFERQRWAEERRLRHRRKQERDRPRKIKGVCRREGCDRPASPRPELPGSPYVIEDYCSLRCLQMDLEEGRGK